MQWPNDRMTDSYFITWPLVCGADLVCSAEQQSLKSGYTMSSAWSYSAVPDPHDQNRFVWHYLYRQLKRMKRIQYICFFITSPMGIWKILIYL